MTPAPATGLAAAVASAVCFGLASAIQHAQALQVARRGALDPRLLLALAARAPWVASFGAEGAAIALQALGLRYAPVAVVQAVVVGGLPVAVVLSAVLDRRGLRAGEVVGLVLCTAGVAVVAAATPGGHAGAVSPAVRPTAVAAALCAVVVAGLLRLARRARPGAGVAAGAAAGVVVGWGAVLLTVCVAEIDTPRRLLTGWPVYALAAIGVVGLLLTQAAFQTGVLGAPLAALTVAEPVVAVLLARVLLHQPLPGGRAAAAAVAAAAVAVAGVVLLAVPPERPATTPGRSPGS